MKLLFVDVTDKTKYRLMFYQFPCFLCQDGEEVEGFSTMCQSNAQWHLPLPECHSTLPESCDTTPILK